jgi:hypothetical protein
MWLTINPADTQGPVSQVLCGPDIDLDNFNAITHQLSDVSIASNTYAPANFLHITVNAVLKCLLRYKGFGQTGILGVVKGYIGTVEA